MADVFGGDKTCKKNRLEAFSDGVLAIIITIMVLELKAPQGVELGALKPVLPTFFGYLLSFIYVAIYWNNHHHLLHTVKLVSGDILWANLHLLFAVSFRHRMDWRESRRANAHRALRIRAPDGGHCLLHFAMRYHCQTGARLFARGSDWTGLERKTLASALPGGNSAFLCASFGWQRRICLRRADVACSRPTH